MPKVRPFNENIEKYEQWFKDFKHIYETELEAIRHFIPKKGKGMEVGIGSGLFAQPLGIKTGVEPSEKMREKAKERGLEVYDACGEKLPFDDQSFDFALIVTTICFLDNVEKAFNEVNRILEDNGKFIIAFVDEASPLGEIYNQIKDHDPFYKEAEFFSTEDVLGLLQKTGFENPEAVQTVFGALDQIKGVQDFKEGHGEGGFVVIRATKK
ncbi:MAG: class I SAM-dependent methyltransferase [Bacteroidales bacterium]|nr:class I SAM-dependent methyltransferase [Bacteroidales bacterium]